MKTCQLKTRLEANPTIWLHEIHLRHNTQLLLQTFRDSLTHLYRCLRCWETLCQFLHSPRSAIAVVQILDLLLLWPCQQVQPFLWFEVLIAHNFQLFHVLHFYFFTATIIQYPHLMGDTGQFIKNNMLISFCSLQSSGYSNMVKWLNHPNQIWDPSGLLISGYQDSFSGLNQPVWRYPVTFV